VYPGPVKTQVALWSCTVCGDGLALLIRVVPSRNWKTWNPEPRDNPGPGQVLKICKVQAEPRIIMWRRDEIVTFVPSSRKIVTFLEVLKKTFSKPGSVTSNLECDEMWRKCDVTSFMCVGCRGGYRDSARLLGESWWTKKWGAIRGKKLLQSREIVVEGMGEIRDSWLKSQMCLILKPNTNAWIASSCHIYCAHFVHAFARICTQLLQALA